MPGGIVATEGHDRTETILADLNHGGQAAVRVKVVVARLMQRIEFYEGSRSPP
jgi:hypothetical protein